jgi:hypothetical protein
LFNGMSMNCVFRSAPGGSRAAVHFVNYSRKAGIPASLYLKKQYRSAQLLSLKPALPFH